MNINTLEYFICVAEEQNITRAAERSCVSQSAITQQMQALEKELKVDLFERHNNRISLTKTGAFFYQRIKILVDQLEAVIGDTQLYERKEDQKLLIGYHNLNEYLWLHKKINGLKTTDKEHVFIKESYLNIEKGVANGLMDLGIYPLSGQPWDSRLNLTKGYFDPTLAIVAQRHQLAAKAQLDIADFSDESIILSRNSYSQQNPEHHYFLDRCQAAAVRPGRVSFVRTAEQAFLMVDEGAGIAVITKDVADLGITFAGEKLPVLSKGKMLGVDKVIICNRDNKKPAIRELFEESNTSE